MKTHITTYYRLNHFFGGSAANDEHAPEVA